MHVSYRSRLAALGSALAVTLAVTACSSGSSGSAGTPGGSTGPAGGEVILVTPTAVGSNNFLQLAVQGVKEAAAKHDLTYDVYESNDPTSIQQNIDAAVRKKPKIVIGVSFSVLDQITQAAADHPDQQFLLVDTSAEKPTPNLTAAVFKEYEATYLTGVEAGLLSTDGKVGVVAAQDIPFIHRWVDPFLAGAKSVDPAAVSQVQYVGGDNPFNDPARAKAQALVLADSGVGYVQAAASGGNAGIFEAAAQHHFLAFGVDTNQCVDSPGNVVDNALKHVDVALSNAVGEILAGKAGGVDVYGLAEGGVGVVAQEDDVASSKCLVADHPDVIAKVKDVAAQIVSGTLKVTDPLAAS